MHTDKQIVETALRTIDQEASALLNLKQYVGSDLAKIVRLIAKSKGRLIITGIGKSANIANKMVATFNSTGTPSVFMHAADAIHGDLGIIQDEDIVMCISKSGNTPEIKVLVPLIRSFSNPLIGMVSDADSYLGRNADYLLRATVSKEACPNNLAPTSSTTAQLVLGDALATCLLELKGFTAEDFARFHPGGSLGKKMYLRVSELYTLNEKPMVRRNASIQDVIVEISGKRLGATAVLDENDTLVGMITDGDIRRMLEYQRDQLSKLTAGDIMNHKPKTVPHNALAVNAFHMMEENNITQIIVTKNGTYAGMVHFHDLAKEGIV